MSGRRWMDGQVGVYRSLQKFSTNSFGGGDGGCGGFPGVLSTQRSFEAPCHLTCASLYRLKAAEGLLQVFGLLYSRQPHGKSIDGTHPSVGLPNAPIHVRNPRSSYDDLLSCSSSPICTLGMGQFQDQSPEGLSDPRPSEALSSHQWSGVFVSLLTFCV